MYRPLDRAQARRWTYCFTLPLRQTFYVFSANVAFFYRHQIQRFPISTSSRSFCLSHFQVFRHLVSRSHHVHRIQFNFSTFDIWLDISSSDQICPFSGLQLRHRFFFGQVCIDMKTSYHILIVSHLSVRWGPTFASVSFWTTAMSISCLNY